MTTFTVPFYFPDESLSIDERAVHLIHSVMLIFQVAHMYFGTTHQSLLRPIHCNNVEVRYFSCLLDRALILCLEARPKQECSNGTEFSGYSDFLEY